MLPDSDSPTAQPANTSLALDVSLDQLCALLGGAAAKPLLADPLNPERQAAATLIASLDAPRAWLSPGITANEPSIGVVRQFALEITSLKLRCFDTLVRLLIGDHHSGGLPAARVRARMLDQPGAMRPSRWSFAIVLTPSTGTTKAGNLGLDLGNLLARLLLSNDQCTTSKAEQLAIKTLQEFSLATKGLKGSSPEQIHEVALAVLTRSELSNSHCVLYDQNLRNRVAGTLLPPSIWLAAMQLILRLQSNIAGFSFGATPLLDLCAELAHLGQQLDVATFGAMARRAEIEAVVRSQLAKLTQRP